MELRSFVKSQWFMLLALVGTVSLATTVYDISTGRFGNKPPPQKEQPNPERKTQTAPISKAQLPALRSKRPAYWVVDASGAQDADNRELAPVLANVSDGDTVELRPGKYQGEVEISKSIHLKGAPEKNSAAGSLIEIHGALRNTLTVFGQVTLDGLTISQETPGNLCSVSVSGKGSVVMKNCVLNSHSTFVAYGEADSQFTASDCKFQSFNTGCAVKITGNGHGSLQSCEFSENLFGPQAIGGGKLQISFCTFRANGKSNGDGNTAAASGAGASLTLDNCQFGSNRAPIYALESASLRVTNSHFQFNGITGEETVSYAGLMRAQNGANIALDSCTMEDNKQGLVAIDGGKIQIGNCHFLRNGQMTQNEALKPFCANFYATGFNTAINITSSTMIDNAFLAIWVTNGAKLTVDGLNMRGGYYGIEVGDEKAAGTADFKNMQIVGSANSAAWIGSGSKAKFEKCTFSNSPSGIDLIAVYSGSNIEFNNCLFVSGGNNGLYCEGGNTMVNVVGSRFSGMQGTGLLCCAQASGVAKECVFENNMWGVQAGLSNQPTVEASLTVENCQINGSRSYGATSVGRGSIILRGVNFTGNAHKTFAEKSASLRQEGSTN